MDEKEFGQGKHTVVQTIYQKNYSIIDCAVRLLRCSSRRIIHIKIKKSWLGSTSPAGSLVADEADMGETDPATAAAGESLGWVL